MEKKERFVKAYEYLKSIGLVHTQKDVAEKMNSTAPNVSSAMKGVESVLTDRFLSRFCEAFNGVFSLNWLLTGEGPMLQPSSEAVPSTDVDQTASYVPLLPLSAHGGRLNDFEASIREIDCEKVTSPIQGADFAMPVCGDSMAPEYPSGSRILVKRIDERAFINWGHVHVLDTCNGTVIKKLFPSPQHPDRVLCRSINPDYPDFEVSFKDIYGVYRVLLCMSIK